MKKIIISLLLIAAISSCKKYTPEPAIYCWECNFDGTGYKDAGCMTIDQFKNQVYYDALGNPYSKATCKMKH